MTRWQLFGNQKLVSMGFFSRWWIGLLKVSLLTPLFHSFAFYVYRLPACLSFLPFSSARFLVHKVSWGDWWTLLWPFCLPAGSWILYVSTRVHVCACAVCLPKKSWVCLSVCLSVWLPAKCLVRLPLSAALQNKSIFLVSSLSSRNFPPNAVGRPRDHRGSYVITFSS